MKFIKNFRIYEGTKVAQLTFEILNMLDRPNVRTLQGANTFGNANFGRTNTAGGVHAHHADHVPVHVLTGVV